jgi:hypothetical protein
VTAAVLVLNAVFIQQPSGGDVQPFSQAVGLDVYPQLRHQIRWTSAPRVDGDGRDGDFDTPKFTVTIDTTVTLLA